MGNYKNTQFAHVKICSICGKEIIEGQTNCHHWKQLIIEFLILTVAGILLLNTVIAIADWALYH